MNPFRSLLAASLLIFGAAPVGADSLPLWEVSGSGNGRVMLLGSMHFLRPGADSLPAAAVQALDEADVVIMELDLDDIDQASAQAAMQRYGIDPGGRTLDTLIGESAWRKAQASAKGLGLDLTMLRPFEPWLAAVTVAQLQLAALGYESDAGVEQQILRLSQRDGKEIRGLETVDQQFSALDSLPNTAQAGFLQQTLDESATMKDDIGRMVDAWRSGDTATMAREFLDPVQEQPQLYRRIVVDRNRDWLRQLRPLLRDGKNYLVVVGTLHLVGPDSLVAMLDDAGFTVRQLQRTGTD